MAESPEAILQGVDGPTPLETAILEGPRHINAFEGRVWTAQDVRDEQRALHDHVVRYGGAIGSGVVDGLSVTLESGSQPGVDAVVGLTPGSAINERGHVLELTNPQRIALTRLTTQAVTEAGLFAPCGAGGSGQTLTQGTWLLVLSPASGFAGRAPKTPPTGNGVAAGCGFRYRHEGVQLRLVQLPLTASDPTSSDLKVLSRFRSQVAHRCFGTLETETFLQNPFVPPASGEPGPVAGLRAAGALDSCDVPLALIAFGLNRVLFIDNWCVRRRPAAPADNASGAMTWPALVDDRRRARAEAIMLQFREHLLWLQSRAPELLQSMAARDYFHFLPPAGAVPWARTNQPGFSMQLFGGLASGGSSPTSVPTTVINAALNESLTHEPLDLADASSTSLHVVRPAGGSTTDYAVFLRSEIVNWKLTHTGILGTGLTQIAALSWKHGEQSNLKLRYEGANAEIRALRTKPDQASKLFGVAFAATVGSGPAKLDFATIDESTFQLYFEFEIDGIDGQVVVQADPLQIIPIEPTQLSPDGTQILGFKLSNEKYPPGAALFLSNATYEQIVTRSTRVWVVMHGDLIQDSHGRAVQARHVRGQLPTASGLGVAGVGIEGGTFLSWLVPVGKPVRIVDLNRATREELIALPTVGEKRAKVILDARAAHNGFSSVDQIKDMLPSYVYRSIRHHLTIGEPIGEATGEATGESPGRGTLG